MRPFPPPKPAVKPNPSSLGLLPSSYRDLHGSPEFTRVATSSPPLRTLNLVTSAKSLLAGISHTFQELRHRPLDDHHSPFRRARAGLHPKKQPFISEGSPPEGSPSCERKVFQKELSVLDLCRSVSYHLSLNKTL